MDFLEAEGGWSLSFSGSGYLGLYHVGVTECLRQRAPRLIQGARRFYGSSSGALNALSIVCGKSTGAWEVVREPRRELSLADIPLGLYTQQPLNLRILVVTSNL